MTVKSSLPTWPGSHQRVVYVALAALMLAVGTLTSCGGGGGAKAPAPAPAGPITTVNVSGTVTYTYIPAISPGGLDYASASPHKMRGAVIEIRNASATTVLSRGNADALGNYSLTAPASTAITIVAKAALGTPTAPDTTVNDNTAAGIPIYAVSLPFTTGTTDATGVNFNATTTFNGSVYTNRSGAPFAILDTIFEGQLLIRSAVPSTVFPPLQVEWSVNNTAASINTTYYDGAGHIFVLGGENQDTDEYDAGVIAHEWGHYIEGSFGRADSLGGSHGGGDILDETVAFGEGWGNAFSGMVRGDPRYVDTFSTHQATVAVFMNVESDSVNDATVVSGSDPRKLDGAWSESSVQEILWDVYDSPGNGDTDGDAVTLGFPAIYAVITGPQKTTRGFTNIYSFLTHLKTLNPGSASAIDALAAAENITTFDDLQETGAGRQRYTSVPNTGTAISVDIDGNATQTYTTYGPISTSDPGNKLRNRLLFVSTAPATGTCRIRVTPVGTPNDLDILLPGGLGAFSSSTVNETYDFSATAGQQIFFSVQSYSAGGAQFSVQVGTPTSVPKPSMPSGNG